MRTILAAGLGVMLLCSACGSGGNKKNDTGDNAAAGDETSVAGALQDIAQAQAAVDDALISLLDLPNGWFVKPPEDDSSDDVNYEFSDQCADFEEATDDEQAPGELAGAESQDFEGPDGQEVSTGVSVFSSAEAAQAQIDELAAIYTRCGQEFADFLTAAFRHGIELAGGDPQAADVTATFAAAETATRADTVQRFEVELRGAFMAVAIELQVDFYYIRNGVTAGFLSYFGEDMTDEDQERLAIHFARKLRDANDSLDD